MSSKKKALSPSPADLAEKILLSQLSNEELYGEVLEKVSADEFQRLEDAIIATWRKDRLQDNDERHLATEEVCFMLGLEIGRRLGGVR